MFGTFRFLLATFVMLDHLPGGLLPNAGLYAVFAFFLLSGYLMTLVLNETYGFSAGGTWRFLTNRALRIYPPYLVALAATVLVFVVRYWLLGYRVGPLVHFSWLDHLGQALLVDLPGKSGARWIPPTWSLDVEVGFYVAMVLLARRRGVVLVWLAASLGYLVYGSLIGHSFLHRYFTFAAASLPFSLGSALYHLRDHVPRPGRLAAVAAVAAFSANVAASRLWRDPLLDGFYVSLALALLAVAMLRDARALRPSPGFRKVDARLGDLAYPLFLVHYAVGVGVAALLPLDATNLVLTISSVLAVFLAWALHRAVEVPIAAWRDRVRPTRRVDASLLGAGGTAPLLEPAPEPRHLGRLSR